MDDLDTSGTWARLTRKHKMLAALLGSSAGVVVPVLGAATSPMIAVGVVLGGVVAIAAMCSPFLSVILTAAVIPLERIGRFTNDNSAVTFSVMRIFGLLGLASLMLHAFLGRTRLRLPLPIVLYAVYIFLCFLTLTHTTDFMDGFKWCSTMVGNLLFLFFVVNAIRTSKQVRLPIILWLITTFAIGGYTVYEWHTGKGVVQNDRFANSGFRSTDDRFSTVMIDYAEFDSIGAVKRVMGATSHPAVYAINILMTMPFYVYLLVTTRSWVLRLFCVSGIALGAYNILLTNTRAAVVALVFTLGLIFFSKLIEHRLAITMVVLIACAAAAPFLPKDLYTRVLTAKNYSASSSAAITIRFQYWVAGVDMFIDHWLTGIGSGNQLELPKRLSNIRMPPNTSIHNEFIESLLETGIIGYPVIVGFMVILFRICLQVTKRAQAIGDRDLHLFGIATVICFVTVLAYGLQCDVFHFTLKGWWLLMGLMIGIHEMRLREPALATERRQLAVPSFQTGAVPA